MNFLKKYIKSNIKINGLKVYKTYNIFGLKFKFCIIKTNKYHINKYLRNIVPYNVVPHKIWEVEDKNSILKLDWNESTLQPSPKVKEALHNLVEKSDFFNLYPKTCNQELLKVLSDYTNLEQKYVQYFASSDAIHEYIAKMYIGESDKVLMLAPSYDNFRLTVQANGADIYFSNVDDNFKFNAEKFEKDINNIKPSFIYIVNPNNPIGYQLDKNYIESLLLKHPNKMFLVDEAYYEFSGNTVAELVKKYQNILVTRTLSKAFGLANFRFGYLISSEENIKSINTIRNPKNISTFTQVAAMAALSDTEYMTNYVSKVKEGREYFIQNLEKYSDFLQCYNSCSNFVLVKFKDFALKSKVFNYLKKHNIYTRNLLQSQLLYNCLRFTIGTKEQMTKVLAVLDNFFSEQNEQKENNDYDKIALFDFCDTIVDFQSGNPFIFYVINKKKSKKLHIKNVLRKLKLSMFKTVIKSYPAKRDILKLLKGLTYDELNKLAQNYYLYEVRTHFNKEVIDKLNELKEQNYKIYVVSGGYSIYLKFFIEEFDLDGLFATDIKFNTNNICEGVFDGYDCMGWEKYYRLKRFFKDKNISNSEIIGFTDSKSDIPMLKLCTKKYAVATKEETWMTQQNCELIKISKN